MLHTNTARTWKCVYWFTDKVLLSSNARFGKLTLVGDDLSISGDDELHLSKADVVSVEKTTIPFGVRAVRIRTNDRTIILAKEWFHITRHLVVADFLGEMGKSLLSLRPT